MADSNQQSDDNHIFSPDELDSAHPISKPNNNDNIQSSTRTKRIKSPIRTATFSTKAENGTHSSSRSRSPTLTKNKRLG